MITELKISCVLLFILASATALSAQTANQFANRPGFYMENNVAFTEECTPVYLGDKNHQVAVLETDFPKVAANFSTAFPEAGNQLWIKEGSNLFVYFSNNGNKVSAVFTAKGTMNYLVAIVPLSIIPKKLVEQIRKDYPLYSFLSAKQIRAGGHTAYELVYENFEKYIVISADEEEIVDTDKIRKAATN